MNSKKLYFFSLLLLHSIFLQNLGLAQTPTPTPHEISQNQTTENKISDANLIHFGDLIEVDILGSLEFDWRGTITPEGFLSGINFVENPIFALCKTETEVAEQVVKGYGKLLRDPKVVVKILDRSNRPLSILNGAVKTPQRFQIKRPVFLNELIIVSGGLSDKASGEIQIFRPQNLSCTAPDAVKTEENANDGISRERFVAASQENGSQYIYVKITDLLSGKKEANPQIFGGDLITVLEAKSIYVIGGVVNPKQVSTRSQITVSRAVASAGGLTKDADAKKVTIFRRANSETKIIEVDLEKIKANVSEDIVLEAFDIVEVAQTGRGKRKYPPVINFVEANKSDNLKLPLRIIE